MNVSVSIYMEWMGIIYLLFSLQCKALWAASIHMKSALYVKFSLTDENCSKINKTRRPFQIPYIVTETLFHICSFCLSSELFQRQHFSSLCPLETKCRDMVISAQLDSMLIGDCEDFQPDSLNTRSLTGMTKQTSKSQAASRIVIFKEFTFAVLDQNTNNKYYCWKIKELTSSI